MFIKTVSFGDRPVSPNAGQQRTLMIDPPWRIVRIRTYAQIFRGSRNPSPNFCRKLHGVRRLPTGGRIRRGIPSPMRHHIQEFIGAGHSLAKVRGGQSFGKIETCESFTTVRRYRRECYRPPPCFCGGTVRRNPGKGVMRGGGSIQCRAIRATTARGRSIAQ